MNFTEFRQLDLATIKTIVATYKSVTELAKDLGISKQSFYLWLTKNGLELGIKIYEEEDF